MHASQTNGHATLPSLKGLACLLAGRASPSGKSVRFDMSGDKQRRYRMTLTLAPHMPYGFIVEDPAGETPWQEIQAYVLDQLGIPRFEDERPQNNGPRDGASHRPSGRAVVRDAEAAVAVPREGAAVPSFHVLDADDALRAKVPDLVWHVAEWIPGNNVTLLGGNGGEGKSLLALQLAHVTRCGMPFFGRSVRAGAAIFYSAEETEDELTWRLQRISQSVLLGGKPENPLKLISMADKPALMATSNGNAGEMKPTPLLLALEELVRDTEAVLLEIDAAADVFGGNEIDRAQVRSFICLLRGVAIRNQCAVLLLSHPSVSGMNDGRGYSGNTAWNNLVRARAYLSTPRTKEGAEIDPCLRQLELMKINNAARGAKVFMRFENGAFHQQDGMTADGMSMEQQAKALAVLLELVQKANDRGERLSAKPSVSYAPTVLEHEAKSRGVTKDQLTWALREGLSQGRLAIREGRHNGKDVRFLVVVSGDTP